MPDTPNFTFEEGGGRPTVEKPQKVSTNCRLPVVFPTVCLLF